VAGFQTEREQRPRLLKLYRRPHRDAGFMRHEQFARKIAYACIFAKTIEEASENLVRLIATSECGFDEGVAAWRVVMKDYLGSPDDLLGLNRFGANFTTAQWRLILEQVHNGLL